MIGGAIRVLCVIVAVGYLVLVGAPSFLGLDITAARLDAVLILFSIAFIAILGIGGWIGYTMATTPPPKPIEEITAETEKQLRPKKQTQNQKRNQRLMHR